MKTGARALGIAESYRSETSTLAGAVVRPDRVAESFVFDTCTVGGTDATATCEQLFDSLGREDIQVVIVAGIAPAWYNIVDLHQLESATDCPVLSVSFEESAGLGDDIREAFDTNGATRRLATYHAQPDRQPVTVNDEQVFVRSVGTDDAPDIVRTFTPEGGRPEPLRVARTAARAAESFRARIDEGRE